MNLQIIYIFWPFVSFETAIWIQTKAKFAFKVVFNWVYDYRFQKDDKLGPIIISGWYMTLGTQTHVTAS